MIFTFATALIAAQAPATPLTIGACAAQRISAADRQNVTASVSSGRAPDEPTFRRLEAHVAACASGAPHGWAVPTAVSQVAQAEMRSDLTERGVDTRIIDRWFAAQGDSIKTDTNVVAQQAETVVVGLLAGGLPEAKLNPNAQQIGGYIGTLIVLERIRRGMSPTP